MEKVMKFLEGDKVIWVTVVFLVLISLLTVYSASEAYANLNYGGNNGFVLLKHSCTLLLGIAVMFLASRLKYRRYARLLTALFWVSIPLLAYTLFFGDNRNNASRVIAIAGLTFQTSDLAKITLIGYLAKVLTKDIEKINTVGSFILRIVLPVGLTVGLIFPENFSTAAMLFAVCLVMMFIARLPMKYTMGLLGVVVLTGGLTIFMGLQIAKAHPGENIGRITTWVNRIDRFMNDDGKEDSDANFQITRSKMAIAGGGLIGKAPGRSTQRYVLPHPYSDFIFAIIIEEYGIIGGLVVVLLYMILLYRATRIMIRAPQSFGALLSMGLTFNLVMQAMVNMGVAVGLLPVTGQPLPFVSMGGTSLLFTGAAFGIIVSVTRDIEKNEEQEAELEEAEADN